MLELKHLKKAYNRKNEILTDINYTFYRGNIYPLLGKNGAGRTTLLECVSGDIPVDAGEVVVTTEGKKEIFLVAKQSVLPMYVTAYEYIHFLCELKRLHVPADDFLDRVHMEEKAKDSLVRDLSFEDKKRLQLAAFLVQRPFVILFDEPFDYCDEQYVKDFLEVLEQEKENHIILISTGLLDMATRIADTMLVVDKGVLSEIPCATLQVPEVKNAILQILGD